MIKVDKEGRIKINELCHELLMTKGLNAFNTVATLLKEVVELDEEPKSKPAGKVTALDQVNAMNADDKEV